MQADFENKTKNIDQMKMFYSTGRLIYDPTLALNVKTTKEPYWLILDCDNQIARYYRWLVRKHLYLDWLIGPAWGAHISIIRGETPTHPEFWGQENGKLLHFEYSGEVRNNGKHYWLDVVSPQISDVRERLGLGRKPKFSNFHLTIGNLDIPPETPEQRVLRLASMLNDPKTNS